MSIWRIALGIGGVGVTVVGAWLGISKKKEHDNHQLKMTKFGGTAKKVNGSLVEQQWRDVKLYDPEHWIWNKKFHSYANRGWTGSGSEHSPSEIRNNPDAFRDYCFEKLEENSGDLNWDKGVNLTDYIPKEKAYWDFCLASNLELQQLERK